jgi:hypothetical protein
MAAVCSVHLRVSRWQFVEIRSEAGHTTSLHGVRTWPDGSAEALGVLSSTDAQAVRTDPNGEQVFFREGTLVEVIDALVELPAPGNPGAPRLVLPGRTRRYGHRDNYQRLFVHPHASRKVT